VRLVRGLVCSVSRARGFCLSARVRASLWRGFLEAGNITGMALTNAEKQARWRARRDAEMKARPEVVEGELHRLNQAADQVTALLGDAAECWAGNISGLLREAASEIARLKRHQKRHRVRNLDGKNRSTCIV